MTSGLQGNLVHLVSGVNAGVTTALLLHPLDTIKVRFQNHEGATGWNASGPYRSSASLVRHLVRTEGAAALYRGVTAAMLASGASWGLYFYFYESAKAVLALQLGSGPLCHTLSGLVAGCSAVLLVNPLWLIKLRMQLQAVLPDGRAKYPSATAALRVIVQQDGVRGLFRGIVPALLLTSNGAVQLAVYEELKRFNLHSRGSRGETSEHLLMGATSKVVATMMTYPFQVAKTRMQRERQPGERAYRRTLSSIGRIAAHEGARGFYKGLGANLLRVAPSSALIFAVYEATRAQLETRAGRVS